MRVIYYGPRNDLYGRRGRVVPSEGLGAWRSDRLLVLFDGDTDAGSRVACKRSSLVPEPEPFYFTD